MSIAPIGKQIPFLKVFESHLGSPAVFCQEAYLVFGLCGAGTGMGSYIGSSGLPRSHRFQWMREDFAATPVADRQQRTIAREFGIEPFACGYGVEQAGTGVGMDNVLRYDAYLCIYERSDLDWVGLTEQATSDPTGSSPSEWEKLRWADRRRAVLLTPYGYLIGVLQIDPERNRLLLTEGTLRSPSYTVFRDGISFKESLSRSFPKMIRDEMGELPVKIYELNRFSEWKEQMEGIGTLYIFG